MLNTINTLFRKPAFPVSLKIINLFVFFALMYYGLSAYSEDAAFIKELRNTNLGNLVVWSFWWPVIIFLSIFFGRIWCMMCPVETVTSFFAKFGLKLKRPKFVLSGWVIVIFYGIILLIGIQGFAIHRNPFYMAVYMLMILVVSILSGIIFEKNTFCRYICPIGYLLGVYSRFSSIGWRVKAKSTCESCSDKSCIEKNYLYHQLDKSCGVDLYPAKIDDNVDCILCAGCLKTCNNFKTVNISERPNPGFVKTGFAKGLFESKQLRIAEMFFVLIVSGFVISEILSEWNVTNAYLTFLPDFLKQLFASKNNIVNGLLYGTVIFIALPLLIWFIPYLFGKILGSKINLRDYLINYGIAFIPIVAAAHVDKSILKITSRLPYLEHLTKDFTGMETARMIVARQIVLAKNPDWMNMFVSISLISIIVLGIFFSVKTVNSVNKRLQTAESSKVFYSIPVLYGMIFFIMIMFWRFLS